jgi:hypothetical protein
VARESAKDISNPNVFIRPDHHYKKRKLPDHTLWVAHPHRSASTTNQGNYFKLV